MTAYFSGLHWTKKRDFELETDTGGRLWMGYAGGEIRRGSSTVVHRRARRAQIRLDLSAWCRFCPLEIAGVATCVATCSNRRCLSRNGLSSDNPCCSLTSIHSLNAEAELQRLDRRILWYKLEFWMR